MPSELENQLERALRAIPPATDEAREGARRGAVDTLVPHSPPRRRMAVRAAFAAAAAACLITAAGVALAASGRVEINVGQPESSTSGTGATPASTSSPLPAGSAALVVRVGDHVWSAGARHLHRLPGRLSTISVSPGAVYELQAKGHLLRAVAYRSGRVAFTLRVPGRVVAASWSPLPIRIAYIEQTPSGFQMHDMWGTGSYDRRAAGLASPVTPTWRWDSLAVAFVRASGHVAILSPTSSTIETLPRSCSISHPQAIAYAPSNALLAVADRHRLAIIDTAGTRPTHCLTHAPGQPALAWIGGHRLALGAGTHLRDLTISWAGVRSHTYAVGGTIAALAPAPHGHQIAIAVHHPPAGTRLFLDTLGEHPRTSRLFALAPVHGPAEIQWR